MGTSTGYGQYGAIASHLVRRQCSPEATWRGAGVETRTIYVLVGAVRADHDIGVIGRTFLDSVRLSGGEIKSAIMCLLRWRERETPGVIMYSEKKEKKRGEREGVLTCSTSVMAPQ